MHAIGLMLEYRFDLKQDAQLLAKLPNFILGPCSQTLYFQPGIENSLHSKRKSHA